jgi:hypothetical protein
MTGPPAISKPELAAGSASLGATNLMVKRIHGTDPDDPQRCLCGQVYPAECRGGWPILRVGWQPILDLAAQGVSFAQIAKRTGLTVHTVRRIVHGT